MSDGSSDDLGKAGPTADEDVTIAPGPSAQVIGRFEAESLFRDTLAAQERVEGPDHPDTMATRASLETVLSDAGR